MNLGQGQAHESLFGPPSEYISLSDFVQSAALREQEQPPCQLFAPSSSGVAKQAWANLSSDEQAAITAECSVTDLQNTLLDVYNNPRLMAHVTKSHDVDVHAIYETADMSNRRKRKRTAVTEPAEEHPEVTALRMKMDVIQLKSWPLTINAASFIRPPKHSDHNTLICTKEFAVGSSSADTREALVFVTIYNRIPWGNRLHSRSSQHVLLSSQTIGDLFDVIPCWSSEIPKECVGDDGGIAGYETSADTDESTGCVICIDGVAYGDGQSAEDYSDKLVAMVNASQEEGDDSEPRLKRGPTMHDTSFRSLSLRLHEPYWLLHAGNCEHLVVVDEIRLHHPSDPPHAAFPLTTQITPPLLDICRACNKVPAVFAIVGDVRLGESPFVICGPCWRWMGERKDAGVVVVPLPRQEHAWDG
ncbi:snRNA-activating protein of 50kDa MW C terminal-domain-containing protein [Sparassis latifolia]